MILTINIYAFARLLLFLGALCPHLNKGVNIPIVRKFIKFHGITGKCLVCFVLNIVWLNGSAYMLMSEDFGSYVLKLFVSVSLIL